MKWYRDRTLLLAVTGMASLVFPAAAAAQTSSFQLEFEGGGVWQSRNNVEIPNDGSATRFSLSDVMGGGAWPAGRVSLTWRLSESRAVRLLYAPLSVTATGMLQGPTDFAGATYASGTPVEATYKFNSYRASYLWRFHSGRRSAAWIGVTGKIRDASIRLSQGSVRSGKDDVGFVPLLHLAASRTFGTRWYLALDGDGLAGGPGRAVDASVKVGYGLSEDWSLGAGYRTVEGGADVESVYNFAWLHYAVVSMMWRL